ncbi:serine-rich adhesin for platelets isoform X2 [Eurosta solidaginis]
MERMKWKQCQEPITTRAHISHTVKSPDETAATAELPPATAAAATAAVSLAAEEQPSTEYRSTLHQEQRKEGDQILQFQQKKLCYDIVDAKSVNTPLYDETNGLHTNAIEDELKAEQQQYTGIAKECYPASDNKTTSHNHNQLHHNNSKLGLNNKICNSSNNNNNTVSSTLKATNSSHTITPENITSVNVHKEKSLFSRTSPPSKHPPTSHLKAAEVHCVPTVEPVDWKPNKKCYFCVDGRLLTVNAKGELVAEPAGPVVSAVGGNRVEHRLETDSDSNESSHINLVNRTTNAAVVNPLVYNNNSNNNSTNNNNNNNNNNNRIDWNKLLTTRLVDLPANMTSMDSMAAQLAVISGYPNFNWLQLVQQQQQQQAHQSSTHQEQVQQQQQQQQQQQTSSATPPTSETSAAAVSPPPLKDSPGPSDATGEQPLDLSSKPSPNSSISGDLKTVRSKTSRITSTPSARHQYTNDAISNAVEDILSGKYSACSKSADQYSGSATSSSTRNRTNFPAMFGKSGNAHIANALLRGLEMDKEVSADECATADGSTGVMGGRGSNASTPQPEPANNSILEELANRLRATQSLLKPGINNGNSDVASRDGNNEGSSPRPNTLFVDAQKRDINSSSNATPQPQQSPQAGIDTTFAILQAFLFTLTSFGALQQRADQPITLRDLVANLKDMLDAHTTGTGDLNVEGLINNGKPNTLDQPLLPLKLQQQHSKSDTPETTSSIETQEQIGDELAASILKIPSYKPAAGTPTPISGSTRASCSPSSLRLNSNANLMPNPNGDSPHSAPSPHISSSIFASNNGTSTTAGRQGSDISVISPPLLQHRQSPPSFSFRDVIARGIHRTMNEQSHQEAHAAAAAVAAASPMLGLCLEMDRSSNNNSEGSSADHKKSTISVVKNIGGTDTTRFRAVPNVFDGAGVANTPSSAASAQNSHGYHQAHLHSMHHHHPHHLSRQEAAALAAGKGTRPKRGKYRNYDRDSLIEAVRAVQRGEMSVHRAGSYFGVPHSTLEYKVKERHLMRPRKREPKPQPGLDGSSSTTSSKANSNIPGHHNNLGKMKLGNTGSTSASSKLNDSLKSNSSTAAAAAVAAAFPSTAPNGMKLPIFDPMQYPAHLFWNHSPSAFTQMHMEFNRNAVVAQSASTSQRYAEDMLHGGASAGTPSNANSPSPIASPLSAVAGHAINMKSAREIAENLYESGGTNGSSILDGIIRKTLDRKSADVGPPQNVGGTGGALLDQLLVKKSSLPPYVCNNDSDHISSAIMNLGNKRAGSPLPYTEIKRERGSPPHSSADDDDDDDASRSGNEEVNYEHNNNNHSKSNMLGNNELEHHHQQLLRTDQRSRSRSRLTSHDSAETDTNSISNEPMPNHNNTNKLGCDVNGSGNSGAGVMVPKAEPSVNLGRAAPPILGGTSILQEKLAQIKAEQENENNL